MSSSLASVYEYLKLLRGQSFGLCVSVLHGTEKSRIIDASTPVATTGANWIVEPSHIVFRSGSHEVLLLLDNVVAVERSLANDTLEVIVRF